MKCLYTQPRFAFLRPQLNQPGITVRGQPHRDAMPHDRQWADGSTPSGGTRDAHVHGQGESFLGRGGSTPPHPDYQSSERPMKRLIPLGSMTGARAGETDSPQSSRCVTGAG